MSEMVEGTVQSRVCDFLPEGYVAYGFVLSIKALDEEGDTTLCHIRGSDLPYWEVEGILRDHLRMVIGGYVEEEDDEDE